MNIFDMIDDVIKGGSERWEKIEALESSLSKQLKQGLDNKIDSREVASLLVLLVEHLRPMNPSKEAAQKAGEEIKRLLEKV